MNAAADLLERLALEVLVPPADVAGLILNEDQLNAAVLGDAAEALAWQPILNRATAVSTRRGASTDSATASIEVGSLSVTLRGEVARDLRIRHSTPIRLRDTTADMTLFTGEVADLRSTFRKPEPEHARYGDRALRF